MADFYDEMAMVAMELLAPTSQDGLGQGTIVLVRYGPADDPTNPWDAPQPGARIETPLNGAARGVSKELIGAPVENGGQVVATDLQVITAPFDAGPVDWYTYFFLPPGGDGTADTPGVLEIDGKPVTILSVSNIPAAGTVCAVRLIVRR